MANGPESFGRRVQRAFIRLVVFVIVVALLGLSGFLLSMLNSRRFSVREVNDHLIVFKGRNLPLGALPYQPTEPRLKEAYAPLPLHGTHLGSLAERTFDEREELDRALFELIRLLAEPRLRDENGERIEEGLYYLQRASLLHDITSEQRQALARMQTDIAYYRGRTLLAQAQKLIAEAQEQLGLAAKTENPHQRSAQQMLLEIEAPTKALEEGLRRSVHLLSAPPPAAPAPAPTPDKSAPPDMSVGPEKASAPDSGT
jgi:hypothetical protein